MTYEISSRYRTIRSMNDDDVNKIIEMVEKYRPRTFLDYGCHFGHLSIELAIRYDMLIYAVDNFTGTIDDAPMKDLIDRATPSGDFFNVFWENVKQAEVLAEGYKGKIVSVRTGALHRVDATFDMAFIDSSHREEEAQEFILICDKVRPGGIIGGHDNGFAGVVAGQNLITNNCEWLDHGYTWFMKKKEG